MSSKKETQSSKRISERKQRSVSDEQKRVALQAIMDNITSNYPRLAQPSPLRTVYVDTGGSDTTGTGSVGSPWKTWLYALNQAGSLGAGTRILVNPGIYTERFNPSGISGTSTNPIEMVCNGADWSAENQWGFDGGNLNYIRFKGLSFRGNSDGQNPNSQTFSSGGGAELVALNSNRQPSGSTAGHLEFLNCQMYRGNRSNLLFGESNQIHIISCKIHRAATTLADGPSTAGTGAGLDHGIYVSRNANNTLVMNTLCVHNLNGYGISTYPGASAVCYTSNTVAKNGKGGISLSSGSYDNVTYYQTTNARLYNNIIARQIPRGTYAHAGGYGIITYTASGAAAPTGTADYNIVYGDTSFNNSTSSPFVWGSNNKQVDPLFNDYANDDFRLGIGSPAIGMAIIEWSPNFDYTGASRS